MLGLSSIASRLYTLEQTVQRSGGPLVPHPMPALEPTDKAHAGATAAAAGTGAPHTHSTILSKLGELTSTFQSLAAQDAQLQAYLASCPAIQSLLDSHASTALSPQVPAALTTREEEVVLSAQDMFERTGDLLRQTRDLAGVLEKKWPIDDFTAINTRVAALQASLPDRAFLAAQQHVHFSAFLQSYAQLIDLCNRQFVRWMTELERVERDIDEKLAQQGRK